MRPATTIVLALLLVALFGAAIIQFTVQGSPINSRDGRSTTSTTSALARATDQSSARV